MQAKYCTTSLRGGAHSRPTRPSCLKCKYSMYQKSEPLLCFSANRHMPPQNCVMKAPGPLLPCISSTCPQRRHRRLLPRAACARRRCRAQRRPRERRHRLRGTASAGAVRRARAERTGAHSETVQVTLSSSRARRTSPLKHGQHESVLFALRWPTRLPIRRPELYTLSRGPSGTVGSVQ